jgi:hypothetical protein
VRQLDGAVFSLPVQKNQTLRRVRSRRPNKKQSNFVSACVLIKTFSASVFHCCDATVYNVDSVHCTYSKTSYSTDFDITLQVLLTGKEKMPLFTL